MEIHPDCKDETHDDCWCLILFTLDDLIDAAARDEAEQASHPDG